MDDRQEGSTSAGPIRLGIVGLGRAWTERYRPALSRRPADWRITAIYDPVAVRAAAEAARSRAAAVDGIRALVARPDVEALLVFVEPWSGPIPVRFALEAARPCVAVLDGVERAQIATAGLLAPTLRFDLGDDPDETLDRLAHVARGGIDPTFANGDILTSPS